MFLRCDECGWLAVRADADPALRAGEAVHGEVCAPGQNCPVLRSDYPPACGHDLDPRGTMVPVPREERPLLEAAWRAGGQPAAQALAIDLRLDQDAPPRTALTPRRGGR